jgi:hypothetical protein
MIAVIRLTVLLGWLALSLGCGDVTPPTAPTALPAAPPPVVQAPPPVGFPPVSSLARVFVFNGRSSYQVRDYTTTSRFVLQPGGVFTLQYGSLGIEYAGTYTEANGRIGFSFTADGRWGADGTLNGDLLDVRYGPIMEHSDFENAVYRRSQ